MFLYLSLLYFIKSSLEERVKAHYSGYMCSSFYTKTKSRLFFSTLLLISCAHLLLLFYPMQVFLNCCSNDGWSCYSDYLVDILVEKKTKKKKLYHNFFFTHLKLYTDKICNLIQGKDRCCDNTAILLLCVSFLLEPYFKSFFIMNKNPA